jgi:DNA polymerase-3 subunit gamma/tau
MEGTTDEGLAQRVRALENKARESADIIDRIRNGQIAVTNAPSSGASLEAPKPVAARKLDKPIPEDIKAVVDGFDRFLGGMKDAALKNFMKTDRPRLSLGADNTLQMVFNNQVTMGIIEAQKKYLEQELADAFGKDIKVEIRALAKGEQFEESYIDLEAIKSAIQFDVVTEDEVNRPVEDTISKDNVSDGASDSQPTGGVSDSIKESQPMDTVPGDVSESQPMDAVSDDLNESQAVDEVSGDISDMHDADYGFMTESLQNLSPEDDGNSFEEKDEPEDEA